MRRLKGRGVGAASAAWLFDSHPGKWLIRVLDDNTGARGFWSKVIAQYTGGCFSLTEELYENWPMQFYRFESCQA